jgi:hypothetical protein
MPMIFMRNMKWDFPEAIEIRAVFNLTCWIPDFQKG